MLPLLRRCRLRAFAVLSLVLWPLHAWASDWVASVDERSGLPMLSRGGSPALSSAFSFWEADWAWTSFSTDFKVQGPYRYALAGRSQALSLDLTAQIARKDQHSLSWTFALDAKRLMHNVKGGGVVFSFDPSLLAGEMGEPKLLPDNRGWYWGTLAGRRIEMRFEPGLARVYVEPGDSSQIRAFFYQDSIKPGQQKISATLSVSGDIALGPTVLERFGLEDPKRWPLDQLSLKTAPVDLSFLNAAEKPAGKRGFVKSAGDQLLFSDDSQARFWGTNITAYALFNTPDADIKQQAKRLSALGFNLVRLHHHDSPWVIPNIFGDDGGKGATGQLSAQSLKKLDWWIKCLKDEGIYVWLDLHVERTVTVNDNILGYEELPKDERNNNAGIKGFAYVNPTIQQAMKRFADQYLSHVNSFTGLAYKDEPAIAAVMITNENDITHHFGNEMLPDKQVPLHSKLYMAEAETFAKQQNLPASQTWRAWEPGPAKLFLNDLERRFNVDMIDHMRKLGVKVPIITTSSWGGDGLFSLPALTAGDAVDVHSYGGEGQLERNPLTSAGIPQWVGAGQVVGKPLTVTEWNTEPFPVPDRHSLPLYMAGTASHQGWDALMQYAYSQESLAGGWVTADNWHAYNDPALLATLPAAALLYRRGDVHEATTTRVFAPSADTLFGRLITPANSVLLRTAMEIGKLQIAMPATAQLPWLHASVIPATAQVFSDPDHSLLDANVSEASSDTGEIHRNWQQGVYTLDTARTQAATGWLGGKTIRLGKVEAKILTANASVVVQSLDKAPLGQSTNLMISLGTRAVPQDEEKVPFHVEPIAGTLTVKAPAGLTLYTHGTLEQMKKLPASYDNGRYTIILDGKQALNWLFLKKSVQATGKSG